MSSCIGVIGGSGFYALDESGDCTTVPVQTPYQQAPVTLYQQEIGGKKVVFIPRHGKEHGIPPHRINYRANIRALKDSGANAILAINVVGGITPSMAPGSLIIPDQIIDYTWGREHTFFDILDNPGNHVDFSWPYDKALAQALEQAAITCGYDITRGGVYGATQGPRLESAAEIIRLESDGCDIVGMTGMPEAALARELAIPYASLALVVNWAAGKSNQEITFDDIISTLNTGTEHLRRIILETIPALS